MPKTRKGTALYFNELTAFDTGALHLGGHLYALDEDNTKLTRIMRYKNRQWGFVADVPGIVYGMGVEMEPVPRCLVLAREGAVYSFGPSGQSRESIDLENNGYLFSLRKIGSHWYVCGSQHMVFRSEPNGWRHFDQGVFVPRKKTVDRQFFDMDGAAEDDIYCVGAGGAMAHFNGNRWTLLENPTNYDLNAVRCLSSDDVVLAGNHGVLFRGTRRGWSRIGDPDYEGDFSSLAAFGGRVYACTVEDLWVIDGDTVARVDHGLGGDVTFYQLCAAGPHLWGTSGQEEIYHFDGKRWEMLRSPESGPPK